MPTWPRGATASMGESVGAAKMAFARERLTKENIRRALGALSAALPVAGSQRELWGTGHLHGGKQVERHLVPGRELKAQYAFDDLWEADRGPA
jgi:hypothetical protein